VLASGGPESGSDAALLAAGLEGAAVALGAEEVTGALLVAALVWLPDEDALVPASGSPLYAGRSNVQLAASKLRPIEPSILEVMNLCL
jgi:hypothetical protein